MSDSLEDELELGRWGFQFERAEAESAYRSHHLSRAIPFLRVGLASSLAVWGAYIVVARYAAPESFTQVAAWALLLPMPLQALCLSVTYRSSGHRWIFPGVALNNTTAGLVAVGLCTLAAHRMDVAMGVTMIATYFGFIIFRMETMLAAISTLPYLLLHQWLLIESLGSGLIDTASAILYSVTAWLAFMTGLPACALIEWTSRQAYRQERIIEAQRQAIERERERADRLLRNVLPESIAERLKLDPSRIAEHFNEVTVLFGDIAGFTPLSETMTPHELVAALDDLFSAFDDIAQRHGLEKIKTIGDAYMVVGGLPTPRANHAESVAEMALEMREVIATRRFAGGRQLRARIGIHTGPVVAGVIGKKKFIYDLWGDTVNTASRMESHGVEGMVQITEATASRLRERYQLSERGAVQIKGKGEMRTWFLEGRKQ